jgi:alkanesulfonate monooxygenase SsuD/methylene tetrahydromethanopterin reductase-like flavin-dependent oxidoreductase (luciferase family)
LDPTSARFDIFIWQGLPWPQLLDDALYLEKLGFGTYWIADHYASVGKPATPVLEAWTMLAALASRTTRMRLGTSVTNISTRHPAMLAKQAATVDCISGGRVDLGLGPGYYEQEHKWLGIPFLTPGGRVDRLREAVEVIDGLLRLGGGGERGERVTLEGDYYHLEEAPFAPIPVQQPRPPLAIAADGRKALRVVARYADIWLTLGVYDATGKESLARVRERGKLLDECCAEISRDPATIERAYFSGWTEEYPFVSAEAFRDFIGSYQEAGIQRFILPFASAGQYEKSVAAGEVADRKALEAFVVGELDSRGN